MGTPKFAVPSLDILLKHNYDVASVITAPDKKKGRGQILSHSDIKHHALKNFITLLQPEKLKDTAFLNTISSFNPDLIVVVAFRILPKEILEIPRLGIFNLHASLLPKYRGAAPINWAIIKGEKETGVTTFFIKEKIDSGNIILQRKVDIDNNDDAGTLHDKLSSLGAETLIETVKLIEKGNLNLTEQDESLATPAPKIFKQDCLINWDQDAHSIYNFVRGLAPYPAAFTYFQNKSVKIFRTKLDQCDAIEIPGRIIIRDKKLFVGTKTKLLEIIELQFEGKKRICAMDFINGVYINADSMFHSKSIYSIKHLS